MEEVTHAQIAQEIKNVNQRIDDVEERFAMFQERIYKDVEKICVNTQPIIEIGATLKTIQKSAAWVLAVAGAASAVAGFIALVS